MERVIRGEVRFLRRKRRNYPIFDEIPRVWRFFKMATMSVFLEEP